MKRIIYFLIAFCSLLFVGNQALAQVSSNVTVAQIKTPSLTPCSGTDTFIVRVKNISAAPISNLVFKDSMPSGINYVAGSVSGSGVTFGSTLTANNKVTFNIASIPASGQVDISFIVTTSCNVSTVAADIFNTYSITWGTNFITPFVTPTYNVYFPSLSITPSVTGTYSASCFTPFVREIQICNGGVGSVDSVTFTDAESNNSLIIQGFSAGTQTGLGTQSAKTVLKAADFMTVGNGDGKLDQNECFILFDTLKVVGSASPITGVLKATWGCANTVCANPTSNTYTLNTTINASSPLQPYLTRTATTIDGTDSAGQIYGRNLTHQSIVKNTGTVVALGSNIEIVTQSMRYIIDSTIKVSYNGAAPVAANWSVFSDGNLVYGNPNGSMGSVMDASYPGRTGHNTIRVNLGDINPGDSVVLTYQTTLAGPVTKTNQTEYSFNNGNQYYCTSSWPSYTQYYKYQDGPAIGLPSNARMYWRGCPSGTFTVCRQDYEGTNRLFNGITYVNTPTRYGLFLARFRSVQPFVNYSELENPAKCAFEEDDTVKVKLQMQVMDLPFYTDKSTFEIKIKTNGGVGWDGNYANAYARISTAATSNWTPYFVDDRSAIDSTIRMHFKRSDCPNSNFGYYNTYAGYIQVFIGFINKCPGPAVKRVMMTRIYNIDSTNTEPAIEAGISDLFPADANWNSSCPGPCSNGVSILKYSHKRITYGQPDNNQDGLPDATGTIDLTKINRNMITWGDTFQVKHTLVVRTTNAAGVPSLYMKSSFNYTNLASAIECNGFLKKLNPTIVLKRPGGGTYSATSSTIPVDSSNEYTANLSLQGTGGISIPGITTYKNGDTVELTQNLVYFKPHSGFDDIEWGFQHVPYTANVIAPTDAQKLKCDSNICNFHTVDMERGAASLRLGAVLCSDSTAVRFGLNGQVAGSGCGTNYFPYESRNVFYPRKVKFAVAASSQFTLGSIRLYWNRVIKGSGTTQCKQVIAGPYLPPSLYTVVGDSVFVDFAQVATFYGFDYRENNLYSYWQLDVTLNYTPSAGQSGCVKDHSRPAYSIPVTGEFESSRPMDTSGVSNTYFKYSFGTLSAILNWPGVNGNYAAMYAGSSATITNVKTIVPVRYTISNGGNNSDFANNWMYIPNRAGMTVDSVKVKSTGALVPTVPGSSIFQLGSIPGGNGTTKDYDIYTTVSLCNDDTLKVYSDRSPCSTYPTSWASYACQSNAVKTEYRYITIAGQLQMVDSLYSVNKDICSADTVQFKVINSQTSTANNIRIGFKLPFAMSLVPGRTQIKYGNGTWQTVPDPTLASGKYTFTQPSGDTLAPVGSPVNILYMRTAVTTSCGFVSGSQITSTINGQVACGEVTNLLNTNPPALNINGAPVLSYFTNPKATVTPITACGTSGQYNYKVSLTISGGPASPSDSIKVKMSNFYGFATYNPNQAGSHNAPPSQPILNTLPDGSLQLSWANGAVISAGDSMVFFFKYSDNTPNTNKCAPAAERISTIGTFINSNVYCATIGANCTVSIPNGADTVDMQTLRPSLSLTTNSILLTKNCAPGNCVNKTQLEMSGLIRNTGTAPILAGTTTTMEVFIDLNENGVIDATDAKFASYVTTSAIAIGADLPFTHLDSIANPYISCGSNCGTTILARFSNSPVGGVQQCFCDTAVTLAVIPVVVLPIQFNSFTAKALDCENVAIEWSTHSEIANDVSFDIQRSSNGVDFETVKHLSGSGRASGNAYREIVAMNGQRSYFRLAMVEDGVKTYTNTMAINNPCDKQLKNIVYPNPVSGTLTVDLKAGHVGVTMKLFTVDGREIYTVAKPEAVNEIDMSKFASGMYILRILKDGVMIDQFKISKN